MASTLPSSSLDCCNRCPSSTVIQIGGGNALLLDTIAALRAVTSSDDNGSATVWGRDAKGDGGGGIYYWDETGTDADDDVSVIRPDDYDGSGVWRKFI